jgi:hypothetical protein
MGISQGSILSATLLSININSLAKVLNDNIKVYLYVDDFLVCYWGKNMEGRKKETQHVPFWQKRFE